MFYFMYYPNKNIIHLKQICFINTSLSRLLARFFKISNSNKADNFKVLQILAQKIYSTLTLLL